LPGVFDFQLMTELVFCHKLRSRFEPVFAEVVTSVKG
jgi:hypothetical protein